jgi:uncharacterized membrane protein
MTLMEFTRDYTLMVSQYEKEGLMALSSLVPEGTLGSLVSMVRDTRDHRCWEMKDNLEPE